MQNENIVENNQIPDTADSILDSPNDYEITEPTASDEPTEPTEPKETVEPTEEETETQGAGEEVVEESEEKAVEEEQLNSEIVVYDYTESLMLIDEHLQLASARIEYCNCLLIIILLIILLQYVYKFFKLFF